MSSTDKNLILSPSPHYHAPVSTSRIMYLVGITLVPAVIMSVFFFGVRVILLYLISVAAAMGTEALIKVIRRRDPVSALDGSSFLTGLLLVMTLPPTVSPLLVILGSVVGIAIGKEVFGGLGANVFNPALVGRAFLAAAYPAKLTTWAEPQQVFGFLAEGTDAASGATPLAAAKFSQNFAPIENLLFGQTKGCIGETSAILIMAGGIILILVKIVRWRIVLSYLATVFLFSGIFYLVDPSTYASPLFHLFAGGLMLGAFYMATDLVTSPYTRLGGFIFGIGAGILVVIIRLFGGLPEGVMYSILIMNAVTPIINRGINNRVFGARKAEEEA